MLSRRELVQNGVLLSTVGVLAPGMAMGSRMPADIWVVDRQMRAAAAMMAAAESGAAEVLPFTGDPGQVWMHVLEPRLKVGASAIGGYTNTSVLFCLQYLARDYGMTLARLGQGMGLSGAIEIDRNTLVDLRDPRFGDQSAAHTWLMLPRRT